MENIKDRIKKIIEDTIKDYDVETKYDGFLVAYGDVNNDLIKNIRAHTISTHYSPFDILPSAKTIISYFIPISKEIANTNINVEDNYASYEWATAYADTNNLLQLIGDNLVKELRAQGYEATNDINKHMVENTTYANWSLKHIAHACGIGTFGRNNCLITKRGCVGRIGTIVTNIDVEHDLPITDEYCLFKRGINCQACLQHCFCEALSENNFNRDLCNEQCLRNAKKYGVSKGGCGKCVVALPCSHQIPQY